MDLTTLNVKEDKSDKYPPRTYYNAKSADLTIAFAVDLTTLGEKLTHRAAGDEKYLGFHLTDSSDTIDLARQLYKRMKKDNVSTINVAGNGIYTLSEHGCSQEFINKFVFEVISKVNEYLPITKVYTGGQTGVDIAGAVAGFALGIPTEVTLPKGFKQRFEDNKDVDGTQDKVVAQVVEGACKVLGVENTIFHLPTKESFNQKDNTNPALLEADPFIDNELTFDGELNTLNCNAVRPMFK